MNRLEFAEELMINFAYRTGLMGGKPYRYLWTDAFAVCNFIELYRKTGNRRYMDIALHLVYQVHHILGKHREDDSRVGWLSGLTDEEAEKHPTIGGLRIGKELPERKPWEEFNWDLEWRRNGQYYHYLTKWMHTLNKVSLVTGNPIYNRWAVELAKKAHSAFTYTLPNGRKSMYWKMSIDLTYPLVPSMGKHDPLDGFITYNELQATIRDIEGPSLEGEIADISSFYEDDWTTDDPLGIGELLSNAYKVAELISKGYWERKDLLMKILDNAYLSLEIYSKNFINTPANYRLAFREFGLSIGLKAINKLYKLALETPTLNEEEIISTTKSLLSYTPLSEKIDEFWIKKENRESKSWREYIDINEVMLATSLIPDGYLGVWI